jgi:pilus assembly protein CpaB
VLTSGTKYDQDEARKDGKAIKTTVVTLAVTPGDAERIALAATEGQIILALRNPLDVDPTQTGGVKMAALMAGTTTSPPVVRAVIPRKPVAAAPAPVVAPPVVVPVARIYTVETIRASKRSEETVR